MMPACSVLVRNEFTQPLMLYQLNALDRRFLRLSELGVTILFSHPWVDARYLGFTAEIRRLPNIRPTLPEVTI